MMDNIISFEPKDKAAENRRDEMLEVINYMKKQIESGQLKEFVAASLDEDGMAQIHVSTLDTPGAVGLFEIGKHILISQDAI